MTEGIGKGRLHVHSPDAQELRRRLIDVRRAERRASSHVHFAARMRMDCTVRHGELEGVLAGVLCRQGHSLA